jgi:sarcosine oxidase subunit alpha
VDHRSNQVVDRSRIVDFTFDGREYVGYSGDTIGSALYRAGVRVFSRSFKYHRPRGLLCLDGSCPNCLVNVDGTPNVRACITRLAAGMAVRSQNAWPSLKHDILAVNDRLDRFLPVGFYYKTFIRPRSLWPVYQTVLRHAAGLGVVDPDPDQHQEPDYEKVYLHTDIAVIGGGPAGMSAALAAAELGTRVVLIDEAPALGGHLRYHVQDIAVETAPHTPGNTQSGFELARELADAIHANPHIQVLNEAVAFGLYQDNEVGVAQGNRLIKLRASQLVVATGQIEQPLVFQNNDLPGIFLGGGLQRLINLYGVRPGERALVVTTNDGGWAVARDLLDYNVEVVCVVDTRSDGKDQASGVSSRGSHTILTAKGNGRVEGAVIVRLNANGNAIPGTEVELKCDIIALATGFAPNSALLYQAGCKFDYDSGQETFVPVHYPPGVRAAGHVVATEGLQALLLEGQTAGLEAALELGGRSDERVRQRLANLKHQLAQHLPADAQPLPAVTDGGKKKFICFCEDVTHKDINDAIDEGFDDIETLKRYSTISMGPCQGKMCSLNAIRLSAHETGRPVVEVGTTTSRPPFRPVKLGALAGRKLEPTRFSPIHQRHLALGAKMMDAGQWKRPEHYGDPHGEVQAVRQWVGLIDVSTLGKIDLRGRDAQEFLERVYTGRFADMRDGRIRYGIMCTEEGIIFDDGVVGRLDDNSYYLTTTSGGVNAVYEWLLWWLTAWGLDAHLSDVTASYAALNLAGPRARDVLASLTDLDLSNHAFPHMHMRQAQLANVPARLLRVGFVGEMGYEIHFPAEHGLYIWDVLMEAGSQFGIKPFGVEAQRILRLEKRHIIIGQDTDALSDPFGAGLSWAVKLDKEDFLGKPSLERLLERKPRERLVGFEMHDDSLVPAEGEQILEDGRLLGRVTSARYSPTLGTAIGIGWVSSEQAQEGAVIRIRTQGQLAAATVVRQPFYDPGGDRLMLTSELDLESATPDRGLPPRLSSLQPAHQRLGAQLLTIAGWQVPQTYTSPESEAAAIASQVGVADLSSLGKLQVWGESAPELLAEAFGGARVAPGHTVPISIQDNAGSFVGASHLARLTSDEFIIITPPGIEGKFARELEGKRAASGLSVTVIDQTSGIAALAVVGPNSYNVLSKLCGLPLHPDDFPDRRVAQTSLARVHTTIIHNDIVGLSAFELFFERPYGEYVWNCILDAGHGSGIIPFGWGAWVDIHLARGAEKRTP